MEMQYQARFAGYHLSHTLYMDIEPGEFVQISNKSENHWFTISKIGCRPGVANVYDSACKYIAQHNKEELQHSTLNTSHDTVYHHTAVQECTTPEWDI